MSTPTQEHINDAILTMLERGLLVAYRDDAGTIRFAKSDWAAAHNVTALTLAEVQRELTAHEPELMARWN